MRKHLPAVALVLGMSFSSASGIAAAPVSGNPDYVGLYVAVFAQCTVPAGSLSACVSAFYAYANRVVADGVVFGTANESFSALRLEVFAANESDPAFQAQIDALFEELLPDSGAIGDGGGTPGPADTGTTLSPGGSTPTPASPV